MKEALNVLSSLMLIGVYVLYIKQTRDDISTPNPATWSIWLFTSIMNAFSYFSVVHENMWEMVYVGTATVLMVITFFFSFINGKFTKLKRKEIFALISAIIVFVLWKVSETIDVVMANILMQIVFVISFHITAERINDGTAKEKYPPWLLAVGAYIVAIISLTIDFDGNWTKLVYPTVNGVGGNGYIAILSIIKKPRIQ